MDQNPFTRRSGTQVSAINRRRSSRVDFKTPVILSGRDAHGEAFREETVTTTVNLHGARVKTSRQILVGMQVSIEHPPSGQAGKAICVRLEEPLPGESAHYIAVQLVRPGNIWGLENPPADWETVAAQVLGPVTPAPPPSIFAEGSDVAAPASALPIIDSQPASWEQQSPELVESVLQTVRQQVQTLMNNALRQFENRLKQMEAEAGNRTEQRSEKALADVAAVVETLRADIAAQLTAHGAQVVDSAEQELHARVSEILAPLMGLSANVLIANQAETLPKK